MLVLYDNVYIGKQLSPYEIKVGMYGFQQVVLAIPKDKGKEIYIKDSKFGPDRRMTADQNTTISALVVMKEDIDGQPFLEIYHNEYAAIPVDPALFASMRVKQFRLGKKDSGQLPDWEETG
jgi:hypothetical protein